MKNQYSKFVKYLEKQDNIFVQRSGDSVYLTDGKAALMVPAMLYNSMIRPLCGLLPELKEDCIGTKRPSDLFVEIRPDGIDIKKVMENLSIDKVIKQSRFLLELPPRGKSKKGDTVRIFKADGGDIIAVNTIFVEMFAECGTGEPWRGAGRWNTPLVQKNDDFMLVMFPVRVNPEFFEFWKEV